jgi:endonuclease V-like protein UPF0215 family
VERLRRLRIRQVKEEIRVLGLAVSNTINGKCIVGAVFRGRLWLDGVISRIALEFDLSEDIIEMVKTSKHYGQVRVVMIDELTLPPDASVDPYKLAESLGKPVLFLHALSDMIDGRYMFMWRDRLVTPVGLNEKDALRILEVTTRDSKPEVLRVANTIASSIPGTALHKV